MLIWLLVLLLLFIVIYVVYRINLRSYSEEEEFENEQHYTFKIRE
jgi:Na+-transporting methylmalonyl-CoA/oxaloacetate decarboxylase gamma subunit